MKIPIRFYYDQGASTAPLLCFCHFYCDSGPFDKILEAWPICCPMEWGVLKKKNISSDQEMTQPKLNPSFKTKMEITERTSDIFNE